jgi:hypothetical protein
VPESHSHPQEVEKVAHLLVWAKTPWGKPAMVKDVQS